MRRVFPVPFRSLLLFTTLRLDAVVPVSNTISTCASSVRSLSTSFSSGFGLGPSSRNINWTALVKGNYIAWNSHNRIPIPQFSQTRSAKMSTSIAEVKEVVDKAGEPAKKKEQKKEEALPKLSAADFKVYNSMAERMNYFRWRDGIEFEGFGGEDGWVWGGVVEAFGSGGRDFGGGEYEEVLVEGGDEEVADVRGGVGVIRRFSICRGVRGGVGRYRGTDA
ncbi:hypothetical protein BOTNAR_0370g00080 [Botryotinia narcissicola]|uniref:Uncharacterized protein n=1 Tax=Botryotinia narcissicola TaxID=278944 RepID=A0A4Z1HQI1_9HELO|nr:hypothetical protein BOTNAR_0370g00080 [Botryotinia narcissicola]